MFSADNKSKNDRKLNNITLTKKEINLRWPNTVFARAFADVIQHAHKDCKNKNVVNRAIILFIQNPHFLRYFLYY